MLSRLVTGVLSAGACMLFFGCGTAPSQSHSNTSESPADVHDHEGDHDHDHSTQGPHGGHVIVLGDEEYHAEVTHDEATHTVVVYLLDASAKEALTEGPAEVTLQLFMDGEFADHVLKRTGEAGMYALTDKVLCDFLLHAVEAKGRIRAEIDGKPYVGVLEHTAHDHSGHDHGAEEADHDQVEAGHEH